MIIVKIPVDSSQWLVIGVSKKEGEEAKGKSSPEQCQGASVAVHKECVSK